MRISFIKVIFIFIFAIVLALLVNFLQPNSLPLINTENKAVLTDQKYENPMADSSENISPDTTFKIDPNQMTVEKNKNKIGDEVLPESDLSSNSDLQNKDKNLNKDIALSKDESLNLNNLTKDVFNQPRLISLNQAYQLYKDKILFIDARDTEVFEKGHIAGAINLPYFTIDDFMYRLDSVDKMEPIVTYCEGADCDMGIRLGNELFSKGYKKVFVFFGGWEEWEKSGYPTVTSDTDIKLN